MAAEREPYRPFETVEFAPITPAASLDRGRPVRAWHGLAGYGLACLVVAVVLIGALGGRHSVPRPSSHAPAPRPQRQHSLGGTGIPGPSSAVVSAFAQHLPGSIVVTELTLKGRSQGLYAVRRRVITAVTGNVRMKVTIAPAASDAALRSGHVVARHGYVFRFSFMGFYPPSAPQLRALADDPRLVSVEA